MPFIQSLMGFQLFYKKLVGIVFSKLFEFFYIMPGKVHISFINLISESFFPSLKKTAFQLFNQFFPKIYPQFTSPRKKLRYLRIHDPRNVKIQDYPRIPSSSVRQGCVGDPGLILMDEFVFLPRTVCRTQGFFLITLNFRTSVCLC